MREIVPGRLPPHVLELAQQHHAALEQLEQILMAPVRPDMDDVAAAVITLNAMFNLVTMELEKLT